MRRITKIEEISQDTETLNVAVYARVSTDSDEQLVSLETQKRHYQKVVSENKNWNLVGLYFDEGISGTKKDGREGLLSMLKDCKSGKIDFILTKSISRLARNTMDCLEIVRSLLELNIGIYFEKENIDTRSMESELMLSILSSLAESESRSISENNKWSIKKRFQNGTYVVSEPPYGYENVNGEMKIYEEEAKIIRKIFHLYLNGEGTYAIAKKLNQLKVPTRRDTLWYASTINGILKNEKYTGDALFQKTFTDSQYKRHKNDGDVDQYFLEDHHEAIISHEDFQKVQNLITKKAMEKGNEKDTEKYQNRYVFSGKIRCGNCGNVFKRRHHYKPSGDYIAWTCNTHIHDLEKCSMKYIKDQDIKWCFTVMMNKLIFSKEVILLPLLNALKTIDSDDQINNLTEIEEELSKIKERKEILNKLVVTGVLEPGIAMREKNDISMEENTLIKQKIGWEVSIRDNEHFIEELENLIYEIDKKAMFTNFPKEFFQKFIDYVEVIDRGTFDFHFKCGLCLREKLGEI